MTSGSCQRELLPDQKSCESAFLPKLVVNCLKRALQMPITAETSCASGGGKQIMSEFDFENTGAGTLFMGFVSRVKGRVVWVQIDVAKASSEIAQSWFFMMLKWYQNA